MILVSVGSHNHNHLAGVTFGFFPRYAAAARNRGTVAAVKACNRRVSAGCRYGRVASDSVRIQPARLPWQDQLYVVLSSAAPCSEYGAVSIPRHHDLEYFEATPFVVLRRSQTNAGLSLLLLLERS